MLLFRKAKHTQLTYMGREGKGGGGGGEAEKFGGEASFPSPHFEPWLGSRIVYL